MTKQRGVIAALVFLVGCAVGGTSARLVVPVANAQQAAALPVWEHLCTRVVVDGWSRAEDLTKVPNDLGAQRWELAGQDRNESDIATLCFKRQKL